MVQKKEWTLFFYMNGNNDLAPEIYNGFLALMNCKCNENVNIIVQISLASKQFLSIVRPFVDYNPHMTYINGRYTINNSKLIMVEVLEDINMSSPYTLSDFLQWGYKNFPAKKTALLLGGHGYENIGCMTDLVGKKAYIMGYEEIASAIAFACKEMYFHLDILFIDTCIPNDLKIVDIFKEYSGSFIYYLLIPIQNSPLEGYPIDGIANIFCNECLNSPLNLIKVLISKILKKTLYYDLMGHIYSNESNFKLKYLNNNEIYAYISSGNINLSQSIKLLIFKRLIKFNNW